MNASDDWVLLAHLVKPQGRRGEILADLHTDFPERFADRRRLFLRREDGSEPAEALLEDFWLPLGKNAGRIVLKFAGCDSIDSVKQLADADVVLPSTQRVSLPEDEFFVHDLVGCIVTDGSAELGSVIDVHFPSTPDGRRIETAAPILILERPDRDELMIPLVKAFLLKPDLAARRIVMQLPAGLIDVNG